MMRCPFCHGGIETREQGVRCKRCQAPHHGACWQEHGNKCSVYGCRSTENAPLTTLGAARIVIAAGKHAIGDALENAHERLGGKSVVLLFMLSCSVVGLGLAPFLYHVHASRKVEVEIVLGALFAILTTWIAGLLYRGAEIEHDLDVQVGERDLKSYYFFARNNSGSGPGRGCTDLNGCDLGGCNGTGTELDAVIGGIILIVLAVVVIFVVLPLVAWLAVEVLLPCIVIAVYGALYGALAFAVNKQEELKGRLIPCVLRALFYAGVYTGIVGVVIAMAFKVFHLNASLPR